MRRLSKKQFFAVLVIVALIVIIRFTGLKDCFTLENLRDNREHLQHFVDSHYWLSVITYILVYVGVVAVTLPVAIFVTLAGGFLFGVFPGVFYAVTGATLGAICSFAWIRHFLGKSLQEKYKDRLASFNKNMHEHGAFYLFGLHLVAIVPFFLINILAGLTNVPLFTFIWTTALGIFPASTLFAYMGQKLGTFNSVDDILTPQVLMAFLGLGLMAMMPVLISKFRKKNN